jgi:predicted amidohydrolase
LVRAIEEARSGGAEMLFTPEMRRPSDRDRERRRLTSHAEEDMVLAAERDAAARLGSGFTSQHGDQARRWTPRQPSVRDDPEGAIRANYDKLHLFDVDLPTGESWRESASYAPGETAVVVEGTPVGTLGLTICYDIRFPALFAALAEAGAETIAVPAAFTVPTGQAHWQTLLRARAIEAGLFVVAAAQAGAHEDGRETYGHSLVAGPWGELLIEMDGAPGLAFAEVDLARIAEVRSRVPALHHRRAIPPVTRA